MNVITAGEIDVPDYIYTTTYVEFEWSGFQSQLDIMLYYVALSNNTLAKDEECKHYVSKVSLCVIHIKCLDRDHFSIGNTHVFLYVCMSVSLTNILCLY